MPDKPLIANPAAYVTPFALGFADENGELTLVSSATPLPTAGDISGGGGTGTAAPVLPDPISGTTSTDTLVGPFAAAADQPIHLTLDGEWTGTVRLLRSIDNGASMLPVTAGGMAWGRYANNVNEAVWVEAVSGAEFYLDMMIEAGTLSYRVAQ